MKHPTWLVALLVITAVSCAGAKPGQPGSRVIGGALLPCPDKPNCVNSFAEKGDHAIAPLTYVGSPETAVSNLVLVVESMPRSRIVASVPGYIHAEYRSRIFRFVDDVEFLVAPSGSVIHVRSASRLGYSDLGVNRKRVESIRTLFGKRQAGDSE